MTYQEKTPEQIKELATKLDKWLEDPEQLVFTTFMVKNKLSDKEYYHLVDNNPELVPAHNRAMIELTKRREAMYKKTRNPILRESRGIYLLQIRK